MFHGTNNNRGNLDDCEDLERSQELQSTREEHLLSFNKSRAPLLRLSTFFFKNLSIYIEYLIEVSKYLKFLLKSGDKSWTNDYAKFTITWMEKEGLLGDVENVFPAHGGRVYMSHGRFPRFLANGQRQ